MKRLALLFLLIGFPVFAQQVIRPTTADYRYEESVLPNGFYLTNWYIDIHYANLPQGRIYKRQLSEDGRWRDSGAEVVVPDVPGATASFTEGIDIRPIPPPIHFFRLVASDTSSPLKIRRQLNLVMKDQPVMRGFWSGGKRKFRKEVVIDIPPQGKLRFKPK